LSFRAYRRGVSPLFRTFNWELRSCGLRGHATYAPTERALAERVQAHTAAGTAWRCLRCGAYVPGAPRGFGPADEAPQVRRGRAVRDAFILRLLALERLLRGLALVALAYGLWRFDGARESFQKVFDSYLPALRPLADRLGVDLNETGPVNAVQQLLAISSSTLLLVTLGVLAYGLLELIEAVGLWLMRRWGEYVAVVRAKAQPIEMMQSLGAGVLERRGDREPDGGADVPPEHRPVHARSLLTATATVPVSGASNTAPSMRALDRARRKVIIERLRSRSRRPGRRAACAPPPSSRSTAVTRNPSRPTSRSQRSQ